MVVKIVVVGMYSAVVTAGTVSGTGVVTVAGVSAV